MENNKLLGEIRVIISETRSFVSRNINHAQIISNWLIGKHIVLNEQGGQKTANYGKGVLKYLSMHLEKEFGSGYSESNLQYFRRYYLYYPISDAVSGISISDDIQNSHAVSGESPMQTFNASIAEKTGFDFIDNFGPISYLLKLHISWTHIRLTLKIDDKDAREFYLKEASECNWGTRALQRQINSFYYERLLKSKDKGIVKNEANEKIKSLTPGDILKDPMVLEFLQLKNQTNYLESELEQAILDHLSEFLLEMGKGFAFVARQKRIRTETKEFAIDLVFYNYLLKCFVLIDLKTRELEHGDIGQIDMYVRYYEENYKLVGDNPTLGIILATEKDETIVRYSILNKSQNLFATKYKLYIPSEQELINEIDKTKMNYKLKF